MPIEFRRDGPWEVPEGWVWVRLGDVAQVNPPTSLDDLPDDLEIPFVPMAAVAEETGIVDISQRRPVAQVRKGYTRFASGDVLFAKITPCMENGKSAALADLPFGCGAGSTEFHVIRSKALNSRYLWYWVVRQTFRGDAQRNMSGSAGQMRVPVDYLRDSLIAVPPLAEQRRIVARIDELFTDIADGEAALARARDDLDTWRRALLKAAVTGELTREWRKHNKPNETGQDFSEKLRQTIVQAIETVPRFGRKATAEDQVEVDLTHLPELPDNWFWSQIGEVGQVSGGLTKNPARSEIARKLPFLRVANVQYGELDLAEIHEIGVFDSELDRVLLRRSDLLIVEGNGSISQIGRCAIWTAEIEQCVHQNHLIKVRFLDARLSAWAFHWLMSPHGRQLVTKVASSTSGLHTLSISKIQAVPIPIPPPAEIEEVLKILSVETDAEGTVKIELGAGVGAISPLRQIILRAAFKGHLVDHDPQDESAETMLARLNSSTLQSTPMSSHGVRRKRSVAGAEA